MRPPSLHRAAERVEARTPDDRDRYADLIRVLAILVVTYGHWTAAVILVDDGSLVATQLLVIEPWTRIATWVVQVMPLFFLVGGKVNAGSLERARSEGRTASEWVRKRARRLLRPLFPLLILWLSAGPLLAWAGVDPDLIERTTETALIPLWFLVVYLLVIMLAPMTERLHRRFGLSLIGVAVLLVVLVDGLDRLGAPMVGELNHLLVFGIAHQLGYLWADDRLPTGTRSLHLTWIGLGTAVLLVGAFGYPLSMVGIEAGADSNATPPTLALLALAVAQLGIVLVLQDPAERWLRSHPVTWAAVATLGTVLITVFLWHMTALIVVASLTHLAGWWPEVTTVDLRWWALRPVWLLLCTAALLPLVSLFMRLEGGGDPVPGRRSTAVAGVAATAGGLYIVLTTGVWDADRPLGVPIVAILLLIVGPALLGVFRRTAGDRSGD
jgi:hypothetical protein